MRDWLRLVELPRWLQGATTPSAREARGDLESSDPLDRMVLTVPLWSARRRKPCKRRLWCPGSSVYCQWLPSMARVGVSKVRNPMAFRVGNPSRLIPGGARTLDAVDAAQVFGALHN